MEIVSRGEAQRRADEIRTFQRELEALQRDKVLTLGAEQRAAIEGHHQKLLTELAGAFDIDRDGRAKQLSLGMRIASFLGALALAASVFFLFYQFWGRFSMLGQVAILITAALGSLVAAVWVRIKDDSGYFAKLAALVAFACFVLNIVMLGSIFNITPSDKAFVVWAAYGFLLAYAFDLRLLLVAALLCVVAFVSARTGTFCGMYWLHFGQRPENFFPAAMLLLAAPHFIRHDRFPEFPAAYRICGLLALFLPMLVLANWGEVSYLDLDRRPIEVIYQVLGFGGTAAFIWLGVRRQWPHMVNTSITLFVILLYTKFYDWWWEAMPKYLFFLVVALTAVLFLVVLRRLRGAAVRP